MKQCKPSKYNFEGQTFNNIQVLKRNTDIQRNGCYYYVKCLKCNKIYTKSAYALTTDLNYSCGCKRYSPDLTNQRFGNLTVKEFVKINTHTEKVWKCQCDCGNYTNLSSNQLTKGYITRCKYCSWKATADRNRKPPIFSKRLKECYVNMKTRVTNPKQDTHNRYINRNISMCKEWMDDYYAFEKWALENGYDETLTLDRINNDGNYEPSNCRWVDRTIQANNRRTNVILEFNGIKDTMMNWSKKLNIPYYYLQRYRSKMTLEEINERYNNNSRFKGKA